MPSDGDDPPSNDAPAPQTAGEDASPDDVPDTVSDDMVIEAPSDGPRRKASAALASCILAEALILLMLVAFCATLVGVSFLLQATRPSLAPPAPTVAALSTSEPAPTETAPPSPVPPTDTPTIASVTPTRSRSTATPAATPTITPTPRRFAAFLPLVIRAPAP